MTYNQGGFVDNASNVPLATQEDICQRLLMENVRLLEKIRVIKTIASDADVDHWGDRLDLIAKFLEDV